MTATAFARIVACLLVLVPVAARAQHSETTLPGLVWPSARAVLFDPTTYAPAAIAYDAKLTDWRTSQVLFAHGWLESNRRFTVTGRPYDVPVSYDEGKRLIQRDAVSVLGTSVLHNLGVGVAERLLIRRFPERRRLIVIASWAERVGFAVWLVRRNAMVHYRQADLNRRHAYEYGYVSP